MTRARNSANLASQGNLFVDISNDRTGIGSVAPAQNLHVAGTAGFHGDTTFVGDSYNVTWDRSENRLKFAEFSGIRLGNNNELQIDHRGTSYILNIDSSPLVIGSHSLLLTDAGTTQNYLNASVNGDLVLYRSGVEKFRTKTYGINVTGTTDTDGLVVSGVATVTTMNVTGVLTYDDVTSVDSVGIVTARAGIHCSSDGVGNGIKVGAGEDLIIQHNGTNSFIDNNTGDLYLQTTGSGDDIFIESADDFFLKVNGSDTAIQAYGGAYVELRHNNDAKIRTNHEGIGVLNSLSTQSMVKMNTSSGQAGALYGVGNNVIALLAANLQWVIKGNSGGSTELYHTGNNKKLETTTYGIDVTGTTGTDGLVVSGVSTVQALQATTGTFSDDVTFTGASYNMTWDKSDNSLIVNDDARIKFGTGKDLHIYHNQSNSVIREEGTGNLNLQTTGGNVEVLTNTTETSAKFISNGAVELYHDGSKKFETTSSGATVSGQLTAGTSGGQNPSQTNWATNSALNLYGSYGGGVAFNDNGNNGFVQYVQSSGTIFNLKCGAVGGALEQVIRAVKDGTVELYHNNLKKLETTSAGVSVTGALNVTTTMHIPDGNVGMQIGNSNDMIMYHNGSNSHIQHQGTGSLYIDSLNNSADIYVRSKDNLHLMTNNNAQNSVICVGNGGVILHNQGNARFNTDADGAVVTEKRFAINRNAGDPYLQFQTSGTTHATLYGGASTGFRIFTTPSGGSSTERFRVTNDGIVAVNSTNATSSSVFKICKDGGGEAQLRFETASVNTASIVLDSSEQLKFKYGGTEVLRIDSSGQLQIGSSTSTANNQFDGPGRLNINNNSADGTVDFAQGIIFTDNTNQQGTWTHGGIVCVGSSGYNGNLIFGTDGNGTRSNSASNISERMRITHDGKVTIATTTPSSNAAAYMFTVADPNNPLGNCGITIRAGTGGGGNTNQGSIFYSNATSGAGEYAGYLQYNHNDNWFRIGVNSDEKFRILSNGNVGINEPSPDKILHISHGSSPTIRLENTDLSLTSGQVVGNIEFKAVAPSGIGANVIGSVESFSDSSVGGSYGLKFRVSTSSSANYEAMRIAQNGMVTIGGNSTVGTKLHIENSSGDAHIRLRGSANCGVLYTRHSDGELIGYTGSGNAVNLGSSNLGISASLSGGEIRFQTGGTASSNERARIDSQGDAIFANSIYFAGNQSGISKDLGRLNVLGSGVYGVTIQHGTSVVMTNEQGQTTQAMVLGDTSSGTNGSALWGVSINNTTSDPTTGSESGWSEKARVEGNGDFVISGSVSASGSDDRLKKNKVGITSALSKVCAMEGFIYEWNDVADKIGMTDGEKHLGLSAQTVEPLVPEVVVINDSLVNHDDGTNDYKTIKYERLVPLLVEAIKDLKTENDSLKTRISALEGS